MSSMEDMKSRYYSFHCRYDTIHWYFSFLCRLHFLLRLNNRLVASTLHLWVCGNRLALCREGHLLHTSYIAYRIYPHWHANGDKYGKLYNWYAVNDPRGIAPNGYHIPTDAEWTQLDDYLGGEESEAGTKMKSTSGWYHNGNGTNSSGFSCLPWKT